MNYGRAIRISRAARGFSQKLLASEAGLDASYISLVEAGKREPSLSALEKLADALGLPLYLLMFLGADENDLRGISRESSKELSSNLLQVVLQSPE